MRLTMNERYPRRMQYLDSGSTTNFTSPYAPVSPPGGGGGHSKTNASSPAVVAVIGVLAGAFLIISYYRIFLKYCNGQHFTIWGTRSDGRNGGPSTIVLMEEHAWPPDASGLDESLICRIPTCKFSPDEGIVDGTECSVCLGEFEVGEELRILPKCNHPFHIPCIDTWLATSSTCPLCRVNIVLAAAVPHSLLPVETEPPDPARAPAISFIPVSHANVVGDAEIEILQEQHEQEFLEVGQLSGPSSSPSLPSSHGSFPSAPNGRISDSHPIDMPILQHMRHLSLETSPKSPAREIHVANAPNSPSLERSVSQQQLNRQAPASLPKQRSYSRARSSGNQKGKHPLLPLSSPQTKRFARLLAKSSTSSRSTGSSSMNQVVVELLAQEIFQSNVSSTDTLESSRVQTSTEVSTSSTGSSRPQPKMRHDNASLELMWSIDELENPLRWSVNEEPQNSLSGLPGPAGNRNQHQHRDSSSGDEMEDLTERLADAMELRSYPGSDCEDHLPTWVSRSSKSFKRTSRSHSAGSFGTWPSKRPSFKHSMARLKRCGSVSLRQPSFRRSDKVHASEPVLEMFMVD